jgi:hypothetical protein
MKHFVIDLEKQPESQAPLTQGRYYLVKRKRFQNDKGQDFGGQLFLGQYLELLGKGVFEYVQSLNEKREFGRELFNLEDIDFAIDIEE